MTAEATGAREARLPRPKFVYNARKVDDGERTSWAIKAADGKRLTYKQQVRS